MPQQVLGATFFGSAERGGVSLVERTVTPSESRILEVAGANDNLRQLLLRLSFALSNGVKLDSHQLFLVGPSGTEKTILAKMFLDDLKGSRNVKVMEPRIGLSTEEVFATAIEEAKTARARGEAFVLFLDEAQQRYFNNQNANNGNVLSLWNKLNAREGVFILGTLTDVDSQRLGEGSAVWGRMTTERVQKPDKDELVDLVAHYVVRKNDAESESVYAKELYEVSASYVDANADYWDLLAENPYDTQSDEFKDLEQRRLQARSQLEQYMEPFLDAVYDPGDGISYLSHREIVEFGINPLADEFAIQRAVVNKGANPSRRGQPPQPITLSRLSERLRARVLANRIQQGGRNIA